MNDSNSNCWCSIDGWQSIKKKLRAGMCCMVLVSSYNIFMFHRQFFLFFLGHFSIFHDFAKSAVFQGFWTFPKVSDFVKLAFFASFSDSPNLEKDRFFAFSYFSNILA